jgi:hypothetical protein
MSTSTALRPSVRVALNALVDYAGLFPPATLAMDAAVAEYARERRGPAAWMLGRFIVPASRVEELLAAIGESGEPFELSVIVDADPEPRRWFASLQETLTAVARLRGQERRVRVGALEVPLPSPASQRETFDAPLGQLGASIDRAGLRDLPVYAEAPRGPRWLESLADTLCAASRARLGAKLRCGGVTAQAFPSVAEVAAFVRAASGAGVAFKATAGLHHPVRHVDAATGFPMHGFLNVLGAAAFASRVDATTLEGIVAEEDAAAFVFDDVGFAWRDRRATLAELESARAAAFVAYGSCSFAEPVEDLIGLRILPASA